MSIHRKFPSSSARFASVTVFSRRVLDALVEAELRQLHRHLDVEAALANLRKGVQVVLGHAFRFGEVREVLTQVGDDGRDALGGERARGLDRVLEPFAGHEARDRSSHEPPSHRALAQPDVL